jgi:oligopeptidase B
MRFQLYAGVLMVSLFVACGDSGKADSFPRLQQLDIPAPKAKRVSYQAQYHGLTLSDDFNWLKDKGYPNVDDQPVLDYLKAENEYYAQYLAPHKKLVDTLFEEFKGRMNDTDTAVPWQKNGYEYRWYFQSGKEYRTWVRRKIGTDAEQVFMDENILAEGHEYFQLGDWAISPDNTYLAYSFDTNGSERYSVKIKDLHTDTYLKDELSNVAGSLLFSPDSNRLVYPLLETDKWRTLSVNLHKLGEPQSKDKVLVTETDDTFSLGFYATSSEEYLVVNSGNSSSDQVAVFKMTELENAPVYLNQRAQKFLLSVDHGNGAFYLLTNDSNINFRLAKVTDTNPVYSDWQDVLVGSSEKFIKGMQVFSEFVAVEQSIQGLESINILPNQGQGFEIQLPEKVASVGMSNNPEFSQNHLRIRYESMITPDSVYDYHIAKQKLDLRKTRSIPSGYDKNLYSTERIMAQARDGVEVPITLVYKKGFKKDGTQPLYLYGYGGYAIGLEPDFSTARLSLLDRGFAYAYAHVRGGDELGFQWYLDGKLDKRTNTFNDFVDVAKHLIKENYVAEGNISIEGGSAGGELMGAAVNQAPELWRSVNLAVPFVDVLNTLLDETLPLTPPEWAEWGNPITSKTVYEYIQSYSPYDNIQAKEYPPMLVIGGLNDPRVTYWEPAKWTAKMRATKTDNNLLVMRMNMGAGHFANTGRYGRLMDYAEEYAFALIAHGIKQ